MANSDHLQRNFIGYGNCPPHPKWPNQARVAVSFVINYEEGGESCVLDGDEQSESFLTELVGLAPRPEGRSLFAESLFEYGSRAGIWRLLNLFDDYGYHFTSWVVGLAAQKHPQVISEIYRAGHEIAGHGYRWIDYNQLSAQQQYQDIEQTMALLESITGEAVNGWYNGSCTELTRQLLVEAGIQYDSDAYNDDLPYWVDVAQQPHLVIPYSFVNNDAKYLLAGGWSDGEDFYRCLKAGFDALYREGEHAPKMMTVALHARISGHPSRAEIIRRFLDYIAQYDDVWVCRRDEIADHWQRHFPCYG